MSGRWQAEADRAGILADAPYGLAQAGRGARLRGALRERVIPLLVLVVLAVAFASLVRAFVPALPPDATTPTPAPSLGLTRSATQKATATFAGGPTGSPPMPAVWWLAES